MAKIDVTNLTEVAYTDGTTNIIAVTMFDRVAAEKYVITHGGKVGNDSPILQNSYATYYALRRDKQITGIDFNNWMATVVALGTPEEDESEAEKDEDGDSLGKSSDSSNGQTAASAEPPAYSVPALA
ncbi:MAG: hypothetical protein ACTILK_00635 [Bifidobacterium crudilactis]|uniref:hypothetical protein n=1 Tax=Bifidobacterium crudilactis TaxID=327277 RepID=UPI003F94B10B